MAVTVLVILEAFEGSVVEVRIQRLLLRHTRRQQPQAVLRGLRGSAQLLLLQLEMLLSPLLLLPGCKLLALFAVLICLREVLVDCKLVNVLVIRVFREHLGSCRCYESHRQYLKS